MSILVYFITGANDGGAPWDMREIRRPGSGTRVVPDFQFHSHEQIGAIEMPVVPGSGTKVKMHGYLWIIREVVIDASNARPFTRESGRPPEEIREAHAIVDRYF